MGLNSCQVVGELGKIMISQQISIFSTFKQIQCYTKKVLFFYQRLYKCCMYGYQKNCLF